MENTPSRSPLGAFVRSPLGVLGSGKVELYYFGERPSIGSVGSKVWQVPSEFTSSSSLPINYSMNGRVWSRDLLSLRFVSGEGNKSWVSPIICAGTDGSYCVATKNYNGSLEFFHSSDLKAWTRTYYFNTSASLICFAWSPLVSKFVALCGDKYAITSSDGVNWDRTEPLLYDRMFGETSVMPLCWNNQDKKFYGWMVNYYLPSPYIDIRTSVDGTNWTSTGVLSNTSSPYDNDVLAPFVNSSDATNSVGIGWYTFPFGVPNRAQSAQIRIYTGSVKWDVVHTASQNLSFCCAGNGIMIAGHGIITDGGGFPNSTKVYYSTDNGLNWGNVIIDGFAFYIGDAGTAVADYCVHSGGKFFLSGYQPTVAGVLGTTIYTSTDGATWTKLQSTAFASGSQFETYP